VVPLSVKATVPLKLVPLTVAVMLEVAVVVTVAPANGEEIVVVVLARLP
jgi:hypothetical protein